MAACAARSHGPRGNAGSQAGSGASGNAAEESAQAVAAQAVRFARLSSRDRQTVRPAGLRTILRRNCARYALAAIAWRGRSGHEVPAGVGVPAAALPLVFSRSKTG